MTHRLEDWNDGIITSELGLTKEAQYAGGPQAFDVALDSQPFQGPRSVTADWL